MRQIHFVLAEESAALHRRMLPAFPCERAGFRFDDDAQASDGWLVISDPKRAEMTTAVPRSRRVLVIGEPSPMNHLPARFVNQFGILVSPYSMPGYRGFWFQSHAGLPWFFGARWEAGVLYPTLSHAELKSLEPPAKSNRVSAIVSNKVMHSGHRQRLRFLEMLQGRLGDRLVLLGRGIREVADKAEAILPYAYHLALENTSEPAYWSEKLADAFLGFSLPLYAGCPDIGRWFPTESLLPIDLSEPEQACDRVEAALASDLQRTRLPAICEARRRILEHETVFDVVARAILASPRQDEQLGERSSGRDCIRPIGRAGIVQRIQREVHRSFHRLTFHTRFAE